MLGATVKNLVAKATWLAVLCTFDVDKGVLIS